MVAGAAVVVSSAGAGVGRGLLAVTRARQRTEAAAVTPLMVRHRLPGAGRGRGFVPSARCAAVCAALSLCCHGNICTQTLYPLRLLVCGLNRFAFMNHHYYVPYPYAFIYSLQKSFFYGYSVWQKMMNAESYLNEVVKNGKFLAVPLIDTYF